MKRPIRLTASELASIDLMITAAQQRGLSGSDLVSRTVDTADIHDAHAQAHAKGLEVSDNDRRIHAQIVELASQLELTATLDELLEARAVIVRQLGS